MHVQVNLRPAHEFLASDIFGLGTLPEFSGDQSVRKIRFTPMLARHLDWPAHTKAPCSYAFVELKQKKEPLIAEREVKVNGVRNISEVLPQFVFVLHYKMDY